MTLQNLRHPNVLQFLGACTKPPNLVMVTEHMPFSLHAVLYTSNAQVRPCAFLVGTSAVGTSARLPASFVTLSTSRLLVHCCVCAHSLAACVNLQPASSS